MRTTQPAITYLVEGLSLPTFLETAVQEIKVLATTYHFILFALINEHSCSYDTNYDKYFLLRARGKQFSSLFHYYSLQLAALASIVDGVSYTLLQTTLLLNIKVEYCLEMSWHACHSLTWRPWPLKIIRPALMHLATTQNLKIMKSTEVQNPRRIPRIITSNARLLAKPRGVAVLPGQFSLLRGLAASVYAI